MVFRTHPATSCDLLCQIAPERVILWFSEPTPQQVATLPETGG